MTCPDRHGLLADVVRALRELPLEITTAAITTRRDSYVHDVFQARAPLIGGCWGSACRRVAREGRARCPHPTAVRCAKRLQVHVEDSGLRPEQISGVVEAVLHPPPQPGGDKKRKTRGSMAHLAAAMHGDGGGGG